MMEMKKSLPALLLVAGTNVQAAEFNVVSVNYNEGDADLSDGICADTAGRCTFRAALEQADALPGADRIVLPPGEFPMNGYFPSPAPSPSPLQPPLTLGAESLNEPVTTSGLVSPGTNVNISESLTIQGAGAGLTVIKAGGEFSVSMASEADTFTMADLTVEADGFTICNVRNSGGTTVLERVEFAGARACNVGATMRVVQSTIRDNFGVGLSNHLGRLEIVDSALINNKNLNYNYDTYGGALSNGGVTTITNTTISGNTAAYGGAISSRGENTRLELNHVTITDNVGTQGPVLYADYASKVVLRGSILSNGDSPSCGASDTAIISSAGYNIESADSCGFTAEGDRMMTDPRLSVLAHFGGGVPSQGPLNGSPAIDAIQMDCPQYDQRGIARPVDGDGIARCDIGAHERVHEEQPPVADAGGPYVVLRDHALQLNGGGSYDVNPESPYLSYFWDFGDGTSGTGKTPSHAYDQLGIHTVTLSVTDGSMQSTPATTTVTVMNNPPIAEAGPYQEVEGNSVVRLDGTASHDPDGEIVGYAWRYVGGGKNQLVIHDANTATPWFLAPKGKFAYGYLLEFELTVTDNDGGTATDWVKIYVPPKPFHYN